MVKIKLRYQKISDANRFFQILSDPGFKYFSARPKTLKEELEFLRKNTKKRKSGKEFNFAILMNDFIVGGAGIKRDTNRIHIGETGYFVDKAYWGMGIATEALKQIEKIAFKMLNLKRIEMRIVPANKGSINVAEKCGFKKEGLLRKGCVCGNKYRDAYLYSKVR